MLYNEVIECAKEINSKTQNNCKTLKKYKLKCKFLTTLHSKTQMQYNGIFQGNDLVLSFPKSKLSRFSLEKTL